MDDVIEPFGEGFVTALAPEFVLVIGLFTLMIVPNLGDAKIPNPANSSSNPVVVWWKAWNVRQ